MQTQTIGVAGAGAMGAGIAQVFAQNNYKVLLFDTNTAQLDKAVAGIQSGLDSLLQKGKITRAQADSTVAAITTVTDANHLIADVIIEAIVEQAEPKQKLLAQLAEVNKPETLLLSNTSSIPITVLAKGIPNGGRVAGLHFFNPATIMKLVEIIAGAETSDKTINTLQNLVLSVGKVPVVCKDSPGFIVNRVARHYYVESLKSLEENAAKPEDIDALMESAGFKMGPFKLMDLVGNDINFAVTSSLYNAFHHEPRFRPSRIQEMKVKAGHLGRKTGKGFYDYR